jgi:hypothetical protein
MVVNKNMVFEIINSFVGREINKLYCIVIFWFQCGRKKTYPLKLYHLIDNWDNVLFKLPKDCQREASKRLKKKGSKVVSVRQTFTNLFLKMKKSGCG